MTWQRIDENTYIDDTLVTCAEYQLFIDEMGEHRKNYQPDHWNSIRFSVGRSRDPILGVRYSDAEAFCKWLTDRERDGGAYRLPAEPKFTQFPVQPASSSLYAGYWISGNSTYDRFVWIGYSPADARLLNRMAIFKRAELRDSQRNISLQQALERSFERAKTRALDIEFSFEHAEVLKIDRRLYDRHAGVDTSIRLLELDLNIAQAMDRVAAINRSVTNTGRLSVDLENAADLLIDIYTFQERIAGRSPAFEGIRLVKERIK